MDYIDYIVGKECPLSVYSNTLATESLMSQLKTLQNEKEAVEYVMSTITEKISSSVIELAKSINGIAKFEDEFGKLSVRGWIIMTDDETYTSYGFMGLDKLMSDFDFAYDHLHTPIGSESSYGILSKIKLLKQGLDTINTNNQKYIDMYFAYKDYSHWECVISQPDIEFIDPNRFLCKGDMTEIFPNKLDVLIDCGMDGIKCGNIDKTEIKYTENFSYTLVTLENNLPLTENISMINIIGG